MATRIMGPKREGVDGMTLGLGRTDVCLSEYSLEWQTAFLRERALLIRVLGGKAAAIEHIGSTSVPGLKAKPILDIAVGLWAMEDAASLIRLLEGLGYVHQPKSGARGRIFFAKGPEDCRTHYLHCEAYDSAHWRSQLLFRDRLIQSPELRQAYQDLKELLAAQYPNDRQRYTQGKEAFIQNVLSAP